MSAAILRSAIPSDPNPNQLLDTNQRPLLGLSPHTLCVWRLDGRYNLPYLKMGRKIKYRRSDLLAWLASRTVTG